VLLVVIFTRREMQASPAAALPSEATVDLTKEAPAAPAGQPTWPHEARSWFEEMREQSRRRRQHSLPVRITMLATLIVTLTVLGLVDAFSGIQLQVYFWASLGVVGLGLLVGMILRRTPGSMATLLIPIAAGLVAFAGSHASLHDGVGERQWTPTTTSIPSQYRLAFGQGTLDLRSLAPLTGPRTVEVTMAAGQVRVIVPSDLNATIEANIHIGQIEVDGRGVIETDRHRHWGGFERQQVIGPPSGAKGAPLTVKIHLADGNISIEHP
jgi:hypothetical protein